MRRPPSQRFRVSATQTSCAPGVVESSISSAPPSSDVGWGGGCTFPSPSPSLFLVTSPFLWLPEGPSQVTHQHKPRGDLKGLLINHK